MTSNSFNVSSKLYIPVKNTVGYEDEEIDTRIKIISQWIGSGKKLLDLGCYDGRYSEIFMKNRNFVYGIDASRKAVKAAKSKGISAEVADLENEFPFPAESFDIIHAGEVIEHLYNTDNFIRECKRVIRRNGSVIITTPNTLSLPRRIIYLLGKGYFFEPSNSFSLEGNAVGHIRYYTFESLIKYFEFNGFKLMRKTSDFVNLPFIKSKLLATLIPTYGRTIIAEFRKI